MEEAAALLQDEEGAEAGPALGLQVKCAGQERDLERSEERERGASKREKSARKASRKPSKRGAGAPHVAPLCGHAPAAASAHARAGRT